MIGPFSLKPFPGSSCLDMFGHNLHGKPLTHHSDLARGWLISGIYALHGRLWIAQNKSPCQVHGRFHVALVRISGVFQSPDLSRNRRKTIGQKGLHLYREHTEKTHLIRVRSQAEIAR